MLYNNIKDIIFELNFPNMFGTKTDYEEKIKDVSALFNAIMKSNSERFSKSFSKLDFSRPITSNSVDIQKQKFVDIVNDNITKIKSGEFFNLPENKESGLTDLYNKLVSAGINKEKLDLFVISVYEDFAKVKNLKDVYSEISSSFFRAKTELLQQLSVEEFKKIQEIQIQTYMQQMHNQIGNQNSGISKNIFDRLLEVNENLLTGRAIVLVVMLIIFLIIIVLNKLMKKNDSRKTPTVG